MLTLATTGAWVCAALLAACAWTLVVLVAIPLLERRRYVAQGVPCMSPFKPLIGDLAELRRVRGSLPYAKWFSRLEGYGVVLYALGPTQRLRVRALDTVKAVLVTHASSFEKPQLMKTILGPLMESGLLLAEGSVHRAHRSIISPAFHFQALRDMAPLIARSAARLARKMLAAGAAAPASPIEFQEEASAVTLHIVAAAAFGAEFEGLLPTALPGEEGGDGAGGSGSGSSSTITGTLADGISSSTSAAAASLPHASADARFMTTSTRALQAAVAQLLNNALLLLPVPSLTRFALYSGGIGKLIARMRTLGGRLIADRRAWRAAAARASGGAPVAAPLLLDRLLEAQAAAASGGGEGRGLSDTEVLDESLTFVLAGHETTSQVLTFAFLCLARAPLWRARLRAELAGVLGAPSPRLPTADDLASLPLLSAVVHETLRLYPPAPIVARACTEDVDLPCSTLPGGVLRMSKGSVCVIPFGSIHRDPDLWPAPDEFDPGRWLPDSSGSAPRLAHPLAFLPFSAGPRNCVGSVFALLEARIILAVLCSRLDWGVHESFVPLEALAITLSPARGLPILVKPLMK